MLVNDVKIVLVRWQQFIKQGCTIYKDMTFVLKAFSQIEYSSSFHE